jgi:putative ABC transport system substrate-binding protein
VVGVLLIVNGFFLLVKAPFLHSHEWRRVVLTASPKRFVVLADFKASLHCPGRRCGVVTPAARLRTWGDSPPTRAETMKAFFLCLVVLASPAVRTGDSAAAEIVVLSSAQVDAYKAAVRGFTAVTRDRIMAEIDMEGDLERGRKAIASLRAKQKPDLILAVGLWALQAVLSHATDIPVVFAMVLNPPSVVGPEARNVTGASINVPVGLTMRVFRELGPQVRRVGVVYSRGRTGYLVEGAEAAARDEGLQLVGKPIQSPREAIPALDALIEERVDALWIVPDETVLAPPVVQHMLLLSYRRKIPLIGLSEGQAQMGALLSLSFGSSEDIGRQAGELANSILAGRTPAEMPYTTARRVNLTVNLKAAQKLGVEIPKSLLSMATTVIR